MLFKALDSLGAKDLELPFIEKEMFSVLLDLNGDKALGLDDF